MPRDSRKCFKSIQNSSSDNTNQNTCYGCGLSSQMIKNRLNIKKINDRAIFKSNRADKGAVVVRWNNSDNFQSEDGDEKNTNLSYG